jgi:transposase
MGENTRLKALEGAGLVHPNLVAVTAPLFAEGRPFFLAADKVQVKYEMLRAHVVDGTAVTDAAVSHGYSRAAFYLVLAAFEQRGMLGLLDQPPGRKGPVKLTAQIAAFLQRADPTWSGARLAAEIERRFRVRLHRRTIERARAR